MTHPASGTQQIGASVPGSITHTDLVSRLGGVKDAKQLTAGDWVLLASYNETLLDQEFKLQDHRISWMMTTQSVLFAAFCLILMNMDKNIKVARLLLDWIPAIAIVIVIGALSGIVAAQLVIYRLENERSFYQAALSKIFHITIPDVGSNRQGSIRHTRLLGFAPVIIIIVMLLVIWVIIVLSRLNILITFDGFNK